MKLCCKPGCKSARAFYNTPHHLEVCLSCRLIYYSDISFLKIPDCSLSIQTLDSISLWLSAIRNHSQSFAIEDIFKGFDGELRAFEELTSELRRRLKQAGEQDLMEEILKIEEESFNLKAQLDKSEMMKNYAFHKVQIRMELEMKGILNQEIEEEKEISGLLTIAKENMVRTFERRYEEKINTRSQELKKDYEEQYRAKIDELEEKVEQQDNIIANHKREIKDLKGKDKENNERIDQLEEDFHKKEAELETIKNDNSSMKNLFDLYKTKTGNGISDKFEDIDFNLSLNSDTHKQVLAAAKLFKLPTLKRLYLTYCSEPSSDLLEFLKSSAPDSVKVLTFGWSISGSIQPIDYYLDGLDIALKAVTQEVVMNQWIHSKDSIERVVKASCNATKFVIRSSKTNLDSDINFSGPEYKIKVSLNTKFY